MRITIKLNRINRLHALLHALLTRHKVAVSDLILILAVLLIGTFLAFQFDIYANQQFVPVRERTIELDEALTLVSILFCGLLMFVARRYREQKKESHKRFASEQLARKLALQDPLTGLANRRQLDEAMLDVMNSPPRPGDSHAIFLVDLNGFKQINDTFGHGAGDEVLIVVARRLAGAVREEDLVARLGGDEFAILCPHVSGVDSAVLIASRLLRAFEAPVCSGQHHHDIGLGMGIALMPFDARTPAEALAKADIALYQAKSGSASAFKFFAPAGASAQAR
jgi:diguanylate cyclase (GGDEF)-like protein